MPINTDPRYVGRAWITPDAPVVAGAARHVDDHLRGRRVRLRRARAPQDRLALRLRLGHARSSPTRRRANYTTVRLETRCPTAVAHLAFEPRGQVRPWFKCLVVVDRRRLALSRRPDPRHDRRHAAAAARARGPRPSASAAASGGSSSIRSAPSSTRCSSASPRLDVVGGGFHRLVVVAPTTVRPGEPFDALVKAEDVWGNPCERFDGEVALGRARGRSRGCPRACALRSGEVAVARLDRAPPARAPARRRASPRATAAIASSPT